MGKTGWMIRICSPEAVYNTITQRKEYETIDYVGNFEGYGDRQLDDVVVFRGMYGLDSYLVWTIHKDLGFYDFSSVILNLRLFLDGNTKARIWEDYYRPVVAKYDASRSQFVVYAISEDSGILDTDLVGESLLFKEGRKGWEVLDEVLTKQDTRYFEQVVYHEPVDKNIKEPEYKQIVLEEAMTIYDFIRYICDDCEYEWYVRNRVLYVGDEVQAIEGMNSSFRIDIETDNVAQTAFFKNVYSNTFSCDVMAHQDKNWRCVWVKHAAGACGGLTKACFVKIGSRHMPREMYFESLDGRIEKFNAVRLLKKEGSEYFMTGSVLFDSGFNEYVDEISIQKYFETDIVNTPHEIRIDRNEVEAITQVQNQVERASRVSPYLDVNAGLLFPSQELTPGTHPPNCIIGFNEGRLESPFILGYLFGNGRGVSLPTKAGKKDFKLILPNGWCLYVDGTTGETVLQISGYPAQGKATTPTGNYIRIAPNGSVTIEGALEIKLGALAATNLAKANHTHICAAPGVSGGPCLLNTTKTKAE